MLAKIVPYVPIGYSARPRRFRPVLPVADLRLDGVVPCRFGPVHRQQSRAWDHVFDSGGKPDAGEPVCPVYPSAIASAFGLHVQWAGQIIPATHAMRVVCGLLLKGNRLPDIFPELWPTALFALAAIMIAVWFYRETLD
jgi:hypothetical protein